MRTSTRGRSVPRTPRLPVTLPPVDDDPLPDDEPAPEPTLAAIPQDGTDVLVFRPRRGARREERRARRESQRIEAPAVPAALAARARDATEPKATGPEPVEMSAIYPLLWMVVPLVLLVLWAILEPYLY